MKKNLISLLLCLTLLVAIMAPSNVNTYTSACEQGSLKIIKVDQFDNPVQGVVFEISTKNNFVGATEIGTTNSSGIILKNEIETGTYFIREKTVPAGYIKSTAVETVCIKANKTATVCFTNIEIGNLKIIKVDQFGNPVPGAMLEISYSSEFVGETAIRTTDADGLILLNGWASGTYYLREKTAPSGYAKSNEVKMVTIDKDICAEVTFINTEIGDLLIKKVDQFGNPVSGAVLEISYSAEFIGETAIRTTDADGLILLNGWASGTYYIRENAAPAGYIKSDEIKIVTISKDAVATVTFSNTEIGDLKIIKVDQFGNPVPGAVLEISYNAEFIGETAVRTTDANGLIILNGWEAGTYFVREKTAPAGYIKSDEVKEVTIDKDEIATVSFINTEIGDLKIIKVDQFETPVVGAVFEISETDDFAIATEIGTTDAEGFIALTGIEAGDYFIREKTAPAGYVKSDEVEMITISKDEIATVSFINTEVGDLEIVKVDQFENPVPGAVFEISETDDFVIATEIGTTDAEGFIALTGIEAGTYYVSEKSAPAGYVKSDEIAMVTIDKDILATVTFINTEIGDLKIMKVDQFSMPVTGAVFELSAESDFEEAMEAGPTDSEGIILVTGLEAGTYYVREKTAPLGYVKSDETKMVVIDKDEIATVSFNNTEVGDLKIIKVDQFENPVPGATFELSSTSDFEESVQLGATDDDGFIIVTGLVAGTYFVREVAGPLGYLKSVEVKEVSIDKDEVATITFINTEVGDLEIVKVDQFENPVPGAVFEISETDDFAIATEIGTTDVEGFISLTGIEAGDYFIREKTAPAGYVKSEEVESVTISNDEVATVNFTNIEIGDLRIIKVNQMDERVAGAVFEISTTNDFADAMEVGTTDDEGVIFIEGLEAGTYYVREKTSPSGYELLAEIKTVSINKDEVAEVTYLNMKDGLLRILKKDAATLGNIEGVVFGIYEDEECTILVNNIEYTTNAEGIIEVELADGIYYIRENAAPVGYILDSTPMQIIMVNGEEKEITIFNTSDETQEEEEEDPQTGTFDYLLLTLGMILLLAGLLLFKAYRRAARINS